MNTNSERLKTDGRIPTGMTEKNPFRILLADDDDEMRKLLTEVFHKAGYAVTECSNGVDLLVHLESFLFPDRNGQPHLDLIISDIRMPGITGMEILEGVQKIKEFPPMILITAFGDDETHQLAKKYNAAAIFDKPFDFDDLLDKVRELLT